MSSTTKGDTEIVVTLISINRKKKKQDIIIPETNPFQWNSGVQRSDVGTVMQLPFIEDWSKYHKSHVLRQNTKHRRYLSLFEHTTGTGPRFDHCCSWESGPEDAPQDDLEVPDQLVPADLLRCAPLRGGVSLYHGHTKIRYPRLSVD